MDFKLDNDAEIVEILDTEDKNIYQFLIRIELKRLFIVFTWDIFKNCEVNMA